MMAPRAIEALARLRTGRGFGAVRPCRVSRPPVAGSADFRAAGSLTSSQQADGGLAIPGRWQARQLSGKQGCAPAKRVNNGGHDSALR